jgi:hypothetical protein
LIDQATKFEKIIKALDTLKYQSLIYFTDNNLIGNLKDRSTGNVLFIDSEKDKGILPIFTTIDLNGVLSKLSKTIQKIEVHDTQNIDSIIVSFTGTTDETINQAYLYLYGPDTLWSILEEDFNSQGDWEVYPGQRAEFLSSQVRFYPLPATAASIVSGYTKPPVFSPYPLPLKVTIEFKFMVTSFYFSSFYLRGVLSNNKYIGLIIASNKIQMSNVGYNVTSNNNAWYSIRMVIDTTKCKVYRAIWNGTVMGPFVLLKEFTTLLTSTGDKFGFDFVPIISGEAYLEYVKIAPGLLLP